MSSSKSIPIVSLRDALAARHLGRALEEHGFVSVVDHGVDPALISGLHAASSSLFALDAVTKRAYQRAALGHQVGYVPPGIEHARDRPDQPDLKEFWHVMPTHERMGEAWPAETPGFRASAMALYDALYALGDELLGLIDQFVGSSSNFQSSLDGGPTLLRVLNYPPLVGGEDGVRSSEHTDINLITLLAAATKSGLQVRTPAGEWIDVDNPPDAIVVNVGDMLQVWSKGRFPSATHRVKNVAGDGGRFSTPMFMHAEPGTILSYVPRLTAGDYLRQRLIEIGVLKE